MQEVFRIADSEVCPPLPHLRVQEPVLGSGGWGWARVFARAESFALGGGLRQPVV